jgi:hypothetical protein
MGFIMLRAHHRPERARAALHNMNVPIETIRHRNSGENPIRGVDRAGDPVGRVAADARGVPSAGDPRSWYGDLPATAKLLDPAHTRIMHQLAADAKGRKQADSVTAK